MNDFIPYINHSRKNFWIVLFIYISIFINSFVFFQQPFEFYLGYIIFIVLLPGFINKFGFNKNLFFIFLILFVVGITHVLIGNNTASQFFKVFIGLFLSYFFYYYVVLELNFDIEQLFKWYLKGAFIVSLIGIFQFVSYQIGFVQGYRLFNILNKWGIITGGNFGIRINSVFAEPTHLGAVLSAAFFVAVYNLIKKDTYGLTRFQSIIIILVYLLSFSGLGQIGVFLTFIFLGISFGLVRYIVVIVPLLSVLFNFLYNNVEEFKTRFDSTFELFVDERDFELGKTHGSSFILYNNYVVATENFKYNFMFGTGIGSHPTAFDKYSIAKNIKVWGFNLNSADANSMFLRLMSETGLFGLGIFLIIIVKCYVKRDKNHITNHWLISNGILIMILLNLFRQGHYFLNGFPFFVIIYYYNSVSYKNYISKSYFQDEENVPILFSN